MIVGDGDQYAEDIDIRERLNWANNRANAINVSWIDDRGGFRVGHAVQVAGIDGCFVRDWHSK